MCSVEFAGSPKDRTITGSFARKGLPTARLAECGLRDSDATNPLMLTDTVGERPGPPIKGQSGYSDLKHSLQPAPCPGRGGRGRRSIAHNQMETNHAL